MSSEMVLKSTMTSNWDIRGDDVVRVTGRRCAGTRLIKSRKGGGGCRQGRIQRGAAGATPLRPSLVCKIPLLARALGLKAEQRYAKRVLRERCVRAF